MSFIYRLTPKHITMTNKLRINIISPSRKRLKLKPEVAAEADVKIDNLVEIYRPIVDRTYEKPLYWYFLTFKPLDKPYKKDKNWFLFKGMEKVKDKLRGCETLFLTRETMAVKVHINALVCTKQDLTKLHNKVCYHKYKIYCDKLYEASNRKRVLKYMCKEIGERKFEKYLDYLYYFPKDYQALDCPNS